MPCRVDPTPYEIEQSRKSREEQQKKLKDREKKAAAKIQARLDEQAQQICRLRYLIIMLTSTKYAVDAQEYDSIVEAQMAHRRFDQQRAIDEVSAQLLETPNDKALYERLVKLASVSEHELIETSLF